jgi:hypothetical protein
MQQNATKKTSEKGHFQRMEAVFGPFVTSFFVALFYILKIDRLSKERSLPLRRTSRQIPLK